LPQGATEIREVRVILLGHGGSGKTSMLNALLSGEGLAMEIPIDDRTIGVDVFRDWCLEGTNIKVRERLW
jgi:GTPase SAR1 family protein